VLLVWDKITHRKPYTKSENTPVHSIEFMGLWDTVAAYGLPIEEMTRGFSQWIWPLELPDRVLAPEVRRACHALSLDDERTTFHPVLWTEAGEKEASPDEEGHRWLKDERISQVWFAGVHANVGGGYPDDALAYIPLYWVMQEARDCGLVFKTDPPSDPDAFRAAASARDKDGRQYDSRAGIAGYYRYGPRKLKDLCHARLSARKGDTVEIRVPKIHETALMRLRSDSNAYAPIGMPADYAVVTSKAEILEPSQNPYENSHEAKVRAEEQEIVWNIVWLRRIVYFATLAASFHLAAFWLFHDQNPQREFNTSLALVSQFIRFVESFFPQQVVHWWADYYATNPISFTVGVLILGTLIEFGSVLDGRVTDRMRTIWKARAQRSTIAQSTLQYFVYAFRSSKAYQATLRALRYFILPFLSAVFLVWLGIVALNHLAYNVADPTGIFCSPSDQTSLETLQEDHPQSTREIVFPTNAFCFATGVKLSKGAKYVVTIAPTESWIDGDYSTNPSGYRIADRSGWGRLEAFLAMPLRRDYFRRWFTVIARIGPQGTYEDFLDPTKDGNAYSGVTNRLKADGELFLYVNDAVVTLPWIYGAFYGDHQGKAHIKVQRLK
jgi:hypothetical protein